MDAGKLFWIFAAVFFLLFALFSITNIEVVYGKAILGLAAACTGAVCCYNVFR